MTELRTHRRVVRNRKKNRVPLSKLRTSDAVKTVVDHPRRLEELLRMLEERDRGVRDRAAAALAQLSESHPARLLRVISRLREALADESAYARWYLVYTLGRLGSRFPTQSRDFLQDLLQRLDDENRVVRILACKALAQVATRKPSMVEELFITAKREIPRSVASVLRHSKTEKEE
jgi:HEAT repeat protein